MRPLAILIAFAIASLMQAKVAIAKTVEEICRSFVPVFEKRNSPEFCGFNFEKFTFKGNKEDQALCLLREARQDDKPGTSLRQLPPTLGRLMKGAAPPTRGKLANYLARCKIPAKQVGGDLDSPLIGFTLGGVRYPSRYFVLHDTALPLFRGANAKTPTNFDLEMINSKDWQHNKFAVGDETSDGNWNYFIDKINFIVNRIGQSKPFVELAKSRSKSATKLEICFNERYAELRNAFIHVEHVMPRSTVRGEVSETEDTYHSVTPASGYTEVQVTRSALLYVVASARAEQWLIPAFHANIDVLSHDDPQRFDIGAWSAAIATVLKDVDTGAAKSCPTLE